MLLAVALTNLEDTDNAKQAYEEALKLDNLDPLIALNFAVFCYKSGDRRAASVHFAEFEKRLNEVREQHSGTNIDPEVSEELCW